MTTKKLLASLEAESALTNLEGILHALDIIRFEDAIDKPGPELHALHVLIPLAVEQAREVRCALFPGSREGDDPPCTCHREASP